MEPKNGNYRKYTSRNPLMRYVVAGFLDEIVSLVDFVEPRAVLDMGCGEGFVARLLGDKSVAGVDISANALAIARESSPGARFVRGDICRLPFRPDSFDLVLGTEVLEHLDKPEKALEEAARLSRRYCIFSVPNEPYFRAMDLLRGKNISRLGNDPEHLHNWTGKGFSRLLSAYFDVLEVRSPFPWTITLCEKKRGTTNSIKETHHE